MPGINTLTIASSLTNIKWDFGDKLTITYDFGGAPRTWFITQIELVEKLKRLEIVKDYDRKSFRWVVIEHDGNEMPLDEFIKERTLPVRLMIEDRERKMQISAAFESGFKSHSKVG